MPWAFQEEKVVGLEIGDRHISACQTRIRSNGRPRLSRAGSIANAPEASEEDLAYSLRSLWKKAGLSSYTVCSALRSKSTVVKQFSFPQTPRNELKASLELEAECSLQLPPDELVLDYHVHRPNGHANGNSPDTTAENVEGILVAAPKTEVDRHIRILRKAGLYPVYVEIPSMAIANLLLTLNSHQPPEECTAILNLTPTSADMAFITNDSRLHLCTIFARQAGWEESHDYLLKSVSDELRYHQFKLRNPAVRNILVTGFIPTLETGDENVGDSVPSENNESEFVRALHKETGTPVEVWNPLEHMDASRHVIHRLQNVRGTIPSLAVGIGTALRKNGK